MSSDAILSKYVKKKKRNAKVAWKQMKLHKTHYLFLFPFALLFFVFYILPLVISVFFSFTYYNVLEPPRFIGLTNYVNLLLADDIFLIAVKNTFIFAVITGPVGYLASFIFAWFINELPRYLKAFATLVFYAPTISGQVYFIWAIIFSGDAYGTMNSFLMRFGFINAPILWLTNPVYIRPVLVIVILWMSLGTQFLSFVAGLQGIDKSQYEAGYVDGIKNRWQELWYITLPGMKPMLLFGAVMSITQAFGIAAVPMALAGFPSTDYAARTVVSHLIDYGSVRFEMGYASAIATILFIVMILCKKGVQAILRRVGT